MHARCLLHARCLSLPTSPLCSPHSFIFAGSMSCQEASICSTVTPSYRHRICTTFSYLQQQQQQQQHAAQGLLLRNMRLDKLHSGSLDRTQNQQHAEHVRLCQES
jgi:hypothetical protein